MARIFIETGRGTEGRSGRKKKITEIDELLGFALSVLHISYDDFCRLSPEEFNLTCKVFNDVQNTQTQDRWERSRLTAYYSAVGAHLDPKQLKRKTPQKLIPLPWDKLPKLKRNPVKGDKERMKKAFEKFGNTYKDGK